MKVSDLKQKNNSRNVVVPRQIAMYLAKQMTEASLPEIGRQFGNKHHTTVMHSIGKIDELAPDRQGPAPHAQQAAGNAERVKAIDQGSVIRRAARCAALLHVVMSTEKKITGRRPFAQNLLRRRI